MRKKRLNTLAIINTIIGIFLLNILINQIYLIATTKSDTDYMCIVVAIFLLGIIFIFSNFLSILRDEIKNNKKIELKETIFKSLKAIIASIVVFLFISILLLVFKEAFIEKTVFLYNIPFVKDMLPALEILPFTILIFANFGHLE